MVKQTVCPNCGGLLRAESHGWICQKCRGFISLQDGKFYEYVEKPFLPPMTNADRIRAMSDEELADWLARTQVENVKEVLEALHITYEGKAEAIEYVKRECLEWLKQPAEVDNG